jgi:hypothetical protein
MLDFILNHLFVIIACGVLLMVLPLIFRTFIKIILMMAAIAVLGSIFYGPNFLNNMQKPIAATQKIAQSTIQPVIKSEVENAKFEYNSTTKQYVIKSNLFKLEGVLDQDKANIIINGKKHTIDVTFLKSFIEKQIAQQTAHQAEII